MGSDRSENLPIKTTQLITVRLDAGFDRMVGANELETEPPILGDELVCLI